MAGIEDTVRSAVREGLRNVLNEAGVAAPFAQRLEIVPLDGGIGRRSYLASAGGRSWVVRLGENDAAGALELAAEAEAASEAAAAGIAPPVVGFDSQRGVLVTEYLAGARPLTSASLQRAESIDRLAGLLKRLHKIRRPFRRYDPEAFANRYLAALDGAGGAGNGPLAKELLALARDYRVRYPSMALCHNDLYAFNMLDDGARLWLVDFEYAVTAAPVLDLAGVAAMNGFDSAERWRLVEAYYDSAAPFTRGELDKVVRLVRLVAYFWALAAARTARDRTPFERVAEQIEAALAQG